MEKELTSQELNNLEYRKKRLRRKLERLELLLSGCGSSLLPRLRGEKGNWSEEHGRSIVRELLNTLDLGLRGWEEKPSVSCPLSQLSPVLTQEQRALFESFFYCALRALEAPLPGPHWSGPRGGTWADLLFFAKATVYSDQYTLYFDELYQGPTGFFGSMDQMYEGLTGIAAVRRASPLDIQTMQERFQKEIAEQELLSPWEALPEEVQMEFSEPLTAFDQVEAAEQAASLAAWRDGFPEKERFCQEYLRLRELYFTAGAWRYLGAWTERTIDLYLYQEGASSFLTDDRYFLTYGLLDRSERQLRAAVEEGGVSRGHPGGIL